MGDLRFFGVLRLRLAQSAAPNSAQDDKLFHSSTPGEEFAPVGVRVLGEEFWDGESFVGSTQILGYAKAMGHGYSVSRGGDSNHWSVNLSPPQNQVQTI
jgi:hypothetical protein